MQKKNSRNANLYIFYHTRISKTERHPIQSVKTADSKSPTPPIPPLNLNPSPTKLRTRTIIPIRVLTMRRDHSTRIISPTQARNHGTPAPSRTRIAQIISSEIAKIRHSITAYGIEISTLGHESRLLAISALAIEVCICRVEICCVEGFGGVAFGFVVPAEEAGEGWGLDVWRGGDVCSVV